jgi:hypothetical protein
MASAGERILIVQSRMWGVPATHSSMNCANSIDRDQFVRNRDQRLAGPRAAIAKVNGRVDMSRRLVKHPIANLVVEVNRLLMACLVSATRTFGRKVVQQEVYDAYSTE